MASLESLNYDCLREILQYCDEDDLFAFVVAFEKFKPIVQDIFRKFGRDLSLRSDDNCAIEIFCPQNLNWRTINSQRLKIFVDLIQSFVEEIYITGENEEMWDIINQSKFAKATELQLHNTSAAPIVKSCFPNLRSLVLFGDSVVAYNPEWNGLENIVLFYPDKGLHRKMEFISQLKLKKFKLGDFQQPIPDRYRNFEYLSELEELSGLIRAMNKLSNAFNVMQKLRKVSVDWLTANHFGSGLDNDISILSKTLATRTVEFFIKFVKPIPTDDIKYLENRLQELPNLKRLTVEFDKIEPIQMILRSCHLHLLKAIILSDMRVDADILTNILISAQQLELLKITCCWMFCTIHLDVARIEQKRSKPITIYLDDSQELEILLSAPTDIIKITKNPFAYPDYFVHYILEQQ